MAGVAVLQIVLSADTYEEEDCIPNSFGLYLGENVPEEDVAYLLDTAEHALATTPAPANGQQQQGQQEPLEPSPDDTEGRVRWLLHKAVLCRRLVLSALQEAVAFTSAQWEEKVPRLRLALDKAKTQMASFAAAVQPGGEGS